MALGIEKALVFGAMIVGSSSAFAAGYGRAGCGLGSLIISPSGPQTIAGTLNQYSGQSLAITTGTSNCKTTSEMAVISKQEDFVSVNLGTLSKEMAQGAGESLAAFSETLGCDQAAFDSVALELKSNYRTIFKAPGAMAVLDTTKDVLKGIPSIGSRCLYLN